MKLLLMGKDPNQLFHRSLFEDPALKKEIILKGITAAAKGNWKIPEK